MKKNKGNRLDFVTKLWGTPIPIIDSSFPPFIKRYWGTLLLFFGYIVLFNPLTSTKKRVEGRTNGNKRSTKAKNVKND